MSALFFTTGLTIILFLSLLVLARIALLIEDENGAIEKEIQMSRIYEEALQERVREIRQFRHDVKGLLQAMDRTASPGPMESSTEERQSSLPLLSAILELKEQQCEQSCVDFLMDKATLISAVQDSGIDETDICLLLQNLLDNAYEASLKIPEKSQRAVYLDMKVNDSIKEIVVTNSISPTEGFSYRTSKANPEQHGIGLKIVDRITKKYGGKRTVEIDGNNHRVKVTVTLDL